MKKISVCMATYNGEKHVFEQLISILPQLRENDEIIVSDDLSKDRTVDIIKGIDDKRIKIYLNERNLGYSKNFENAINHASGDVIFIADQDDVWYPTKVTKMLKVLDHADMVISDAEIVDGNLSRIHDSHFTLNNTKRGFWVNLLKTRYIGACMAFKREILTKALPLPGNTELCAYDYWLAVISECYYKVALIGEPLIKYRRHGGNASSGGVSSNNSFARKVVIRLYTLMELLKR